MKTLGSWAIATVLAGLLLSDGAASQSKGPTFTVRMTAPVGQAVKGRLLILAEPVPRAGVVDRVSVNPSPASSSAAAARPDVVLAQGQSVEVDSNLIAFPAFSQLKPGTYLVQAALDVHAMAAYNDQVRPGDITGPITQVTLPADHVSLTLDKVAPETPAPWDRPDPASAAVKAHTERLTFPSKLLTSFWKQPTGIRAYVLTPPGYEQDKTTRYPVAFETEGFGATFDGNFIRVQRTYADMVSGAEPRMIWVFIDHAGPTGTNEFADSANNGPWGKALTTEFIPWVDGKYRTDGKASGRFTTGHSSGGWASLWLQVAYPKLFGGAWPTSPDPVDFHDFTNINLYQAGANAYRRPDGSPTQLVRSTRTPATLEQYAKSERVLGPVGGQFSSFDWVFSPRGKDGRPIPLFNETTGAVDPAVAAYWNAHYDITALIKRDWKTLKPDLDGKIHLWVGTLDTFYLDGPAHLLKATLDGLGARSEFHFIDGADHGSVMVENGDPRAVERTIAWQMYAVARPGTKRPAKP
jgi:enterochelin esterase-like enzyme